MPGLFMSRNCPPSKVALNAQGLCAIPAPDKCPRCAAPPLLPRHFQALWQVITQMADLYGDLFSVLHFAGDFAPGYGNQWTEKALRTAGTLTELERHIIAPGGTLGDQ